MALLSSLEYVVANMAEQDSIYDGERSCLVIAPIVAVNGEFANPSMLQLSMDPPFPAAKMNTDPRPFLPYSIPRKMASKTMGSGPSITEPSSEGPHEQQ